jgi:alpha-glucosidase
MMAGNVDFTPGAMRNGTRSNWVECYEKPVSMGTRCHQAACYVLHDSPFTMLCDAPTNYEREPDYTKFIASIPVVWDETRVLQGEMGKYIIVARRLGDVWYVGGQTSWDERDVEIPLSFLGEGSYTTTLLTDGINASHDAQDYQLDTQFHHNGERLTIHMASGGGFVLKFGKLTIVDHF